MSDDIKYKASRYSHFVENHDGNILAFNAMSRFLGHMDKKDYELYGKIVNGKILDYTETEALQDLVEKLAQGSFLIPDKCNEIQNLKARHYLTRFNVQGLNLTIIPTFQCNFACDYCYEPGNADFNRESKTEAMKQEVQDGLVEMVKTMLPFETALSIGWYGGEPLLGLEVIESLTERFRKLCEEKKAQYNAGIVTNGYLLTPKVIDRLIRLNINFAQVTIDGPEEIHNKRRPLVGNGPTYQTIVDNLKKIPEDTKFYLSIRVNIDKRNRDHIPILLHELRQHNLHNRKNVSIYFGQVHTDNHACNDIGNSCILTREFATQDLDLYKEAAKLGFRIDNYPMPMLSGCGAICSNSFVVEPDGNLHACWETVGREEMSIGKIENSAAKLNHDNYYKWLSYSPFEKKECLNCSVLPLCMGGCPYRSVYESNFPKQQKNACMVWKYNLKDRIKFYVEAHKIGLFIPPGSRLKNKEVGSQT